MNGRVGPNIHRDAWPTPTVLAGHLAAGLSWVQVHTPPPVVLGDHRSALRHARGVRDGLADSGLRRVLHGPTTSAPASPTPTARSRACSDCAGGGRRDRRPPRPELRGRRRPRSRARPERARLEERSLVTLPQRPAFPCVMVAIESSRPCTRGLVRRLDSPAAGMLLDLR